MGVQFGIIGALFFVSLFFTDERIVIVNITLWLFSMYMAGSTKYSGVTKGAVLLYVLFLIITFFIEIMFLRIAAIEERKYSKVFWTGFTVIFSFLMFVIIKSPDREINIIQLMMGALLLTCIVSFLLYELCFIYIFVPFSIKYAKREKLLNADIKGERRTAGRSSTYIALTIANYSSKDFRCNKKTRMKLEKRMQLEKRQKDVKTIEAIRVPLFNRIIIPEI